MSVAIMITKRTRRSPIELSSATNRPFLTAAGLGNDYERRPAAIRAGGEHDCRHISTDCVDLIRAAARLREASLQQL